MAEGEKSDSIPISPDATSSDVPLGRLILLVEDDPLVRHSTQIRLQSRGYRVTTAASGGEAKEILRRTSADVVICDLRLPDMSGLEVLRFCQTLTPEPIFLVITGFATVDSALEALRLGAVEYFPKPVNIDHLTLVIGRSLEHRRLQAEHERLMQEQTRRDRFEDLLGGSPAMNALYRQIERVAAADAAVLLCGETGVGKELVARAIHRRSKRRAYPFIAVNCGSLPESLLESELFGHERGAFTGAGEGKRGFFEAASEGVILLDEIEAAPPRTQVAFLRVLEQREVMPVGGRAPKPVRCRIIACTNQDLEALAEEGKFREDLFYRLAQICVRVPPLRDRLEDIELLARHFLSQVETPARDFSPRALEMLRRYSWPGNVRELKNAVFQAALAAQGQIIRPADLPQFLRENAETAMPTLAEQERRLLAEALRRAGGNKAEAARLLGLSRNTIYALLKKHGLEDYA
ncbi:MAG: sigma-54 dependent transcriptional regulator [Planctomycetota bacterium]|nr:sigma-54 dependent transcriptional regulator [Planctomycetota bacterium]